jgi:hypothetical protein
VVLFFNELEIKKPCSRLVSFLNELQIRKSCSKTSVSFFNEVASEIKKNILGVFLSMDTKRTMLRKETMSRDKTWSWLPRGFHWKEETHFGRTPCRRSRQE